MNSEKQLTFEEYKKLSSEDQIKRYVELTDKDKFIARTSCYIQPITVGKIDMNKYLTDEIKKEIEKARNEINEYLDNYKKKKN